MIYAPCAPIHVLIMLAIDAATEAEYCFMPDTSAPTDNALDVLLYEALDDETDATAERRDREAALYG